MFRKDYQGEFLSVLYSCGPSPLKLWDTRVKNGCIRRVTDEQVMSLALEISGTNVTTTYIYSPKDPKKTLGIRLPFLTMIIKNMKRYFTMEITVLDDAKMSRRFRMSNFQSATKTVPFSTSMPICLSEGWNQIQLNLADFTRRAYGTNYMETSRIQIHANCRIRRIYFTDRLHDEEDIPLEYKLFLPSQKKCVKEIKPEEPVESLKEEEVPEIVETESQEHIPEEGSEQTFSFEDEVKKFIEDEDNESKSQDRDRDRDERLSEEFEEYELKQTSFHGYRELRSEPLTQWREDLAE